MKTIIARLEQLSKEVLGVVTSRQGLKDLLNIPLYANSVYLMMNAATGAVLGFIFWIVAARLYSSEDVGLASALISAAVLLTFIASFGLGIGLIRFLPSAGSESPKLVNSCFTMTGLAAVGLAVVFLIGLPLWSPALNFVRESYIFIGAFIIFVITGTILERLAEVFIALRRTGFVLLMYVVNGLIRVAFIVILASNFKVFGIFASCVLAATLALGLGLLLFLPRLIPGYRPLPSLGAQVTGDMFRFSFANYIGSTLWIAPTWLLPIIVVNLLGGENNAYFYISWSIAALLFAIPNSVAMALFAEGSYRGSSLKHDVMRSLKVMIVLLLPAIVLLLIAGGKVLLLFGNEYSLAGEKLLWILSPSAIPMAVNVVYIGIARVRKRLKDIILLSAGVALGTLSLSYLLIPPLGIMGPGIGWLASNTLVALVVLPRIIKLFRSESVTDTS